MLGSNGSSHSTWKYSPVIRPKLQGLYSYPLLLCHCSLLSLSPASPRVLVCRATFYSFLFSKHGAEALGMRIVQL